MARIPPKLPEFLRRFEEAQDGWPHPEHAARASEYRANRGIILVGKPAWQDDCLVLCCENLCSAVAG